MCNQCKNCNCQIDKFKLVSELAVYITNKIAGKSYDEMFPYFYFYMKDSDGHIDCHILELYAFEHDTFFRVDPEKPAFQLSEKEWESVEWFEIGKVKDDELVQMLKKDFVRPQ